MSKYQEAIKILNKYRNSYYNSICKEQREIANVLDVVLPKIAKEHELLDVKNQLIHQYQVYLVAVDTKDHACKEGTKQVIFMLLNTIREREEELKEGERK